MKKNWVKNLIFSIKNFISSLFPPACYEFCYKEKERDGYAVFGMCGGVTGGDYYTDYLSYSCIECPYLVLTSPNEKEG